MKVASQKELDSARKEVDEYTQSLGYPVNESLGRRTIRGKPDNRFRQALASEMRKEDLQV